MARRPIISRFVAYIREIVAELKKVVWPTREETRRLSTMVIAIAIAVGVLLGAIDLGFTRLVDLFLGG